MKKIIACAAGLTLLSACSGESAEEASEEPAAVEVTSEVTFAEHLGTWDVTYPDGTTGVTTNRPDGTFTRIVGDAEPVEGLWAMSDEGTSCWDSGAETGAVCYVVGPADESGTRVLTAEDGSEVMVTPAAEEAAQ